MEQLQDHRTPRWRWASYNRLRRFTIQTWRRGYHPAQFSPWQQVRLGRRGVQLSLQHGFIHVSICFPTDECLFFFPLMLIQKPL